MELKRKLKNIPSTSSEADIQSGILKLFDYSRLLHWRQNVGGIPARIGRDGKPIFRRNPMKGFPDIGGVIEINGFGVLWAMEIKTQKGKLTKEQKEWLQVLGESGVICAVVRSIQDAEAFICKLKKIKLEYEQGIIQK